MYVCAWIENLALFAAQIPSGIFPIEEKKPIDYLFNRKSKCDH